MENPQARSQDSLQRIDIYAKWMIGIVGLVLSASIGVATYNINRRTIENNRQASERQIQGQINALATQRQAVGAQLAATLLPTILKGTDSERNLALKVLASFAPDQAERIGGIVLASVSSPVAQRQVKEIIEKSITVKNENELAQHLENARRYRESFLDASACREYFRAFENLAAPSQQRVKEQFKAASRDYDQGRFTEAAQKLEEALKPWIGQSGGPLGGLVL